MHLGLGPIGREVLSHVPFLHVRSHLAPDESAILWQLRAPRVVLGVLVGAMLASAGATYQGVFRNPLADPYLLGVAAGAGLGATLAIAYGGGTAFTGDLLPLAAFVGGGIAVALTYVVGRSAGRGRGSAAFVLAGVTVTSFFTAVQTFFQQRHADTLQAVYSWILGRLDTAGWHDVLLLLPYAGCSMAALLLHRRLLDVLSLGDDEAAALGVSVGRVRFVLVVTRDAGHCGGRRGQRPDRLSRRDRPAHSAAARRRVVPARPAAFHPRRRRVSHFCGRDRAHGDRSPDELPIGVVTAFFGAPFFAIVLRTSRFGGPS